MRKHSTWCSSHLLGKVGQSLKSTKIYFLANCHKVTVLTAAAENRITNCILAVLEKSVWFEQWKTSGCVIVK